MPKNDENWVFVAISHPGRPKLLDQSGSWLDLDGKIQDDGFGPFAGYKMAMGGRQRAQKCPKMMKIGYFWP